MISCNHNKTSEHVEKIQIKHKFKQLYKIKI